MPPDTKSRNIRIDDDLWAEAQAIATERRETVTAVLRAALVEYVDTYGKRGPLVPIVDAIPEVTMFFPMAAEAEEMVGRVLVYNGGERAHRFTVVGVEPTDNSGQYSLTLEKA